MHVARNRLARCRRCDSPSPSDAGPGPVPRTVPRAVRGCDVDADGHRRHVTPGSGPDDVAWRGGVHRVQGAEAKRGSVPARTCQRRNRCGALAGRARIGRCGPLGPSMQPASVTTTSAAVAYSAPSDNSATTTICCVPARRMRASTSTRSTARGNSNTARSGTGFVSANTRSARTVGPGANGPGTTMRIGTGEAVVGQRRQLEAHPSFARHASREIGGQRGYRPAAARGQGQRRARDGEQRTCALQQPPAVWSTTRAAVRGSVAQQRISAHRSVTR